MAIRLVKCALALLLLSTLSFAPMLAQGGTITILVSDLENHNLLADASIRLVAAGGEALAEGSSGTDGSCRLRSVAAGTYQLVVALVGYQTAIVDGVRVTASQVTELRVQLSSYAMHLNPVVVTASRRQEKALSAPAAVSVVVSGDVEERPATSTVDHIRAVPGADIFTTGVQQSNVAARGFNGVFSKALFVLSDNRWASVPSLRFNGYTLIPNTDEDVERIEFVLGPGSALYGPNVDKGVMHIITRSPLDHQGTTVSITGGERRVFQGSFRHSGLIGDNVGYKISGLYFRGDDWQFGDLAEAQGRQVAIAAGADADTLLIGLRDSVAERFSGDARLDIRLDDRTSVALSGGFSQLIGSIELTEIGAAQGNGWTYGYLQARFRRNELFAQTYLNLSDAGDTYMLRSGAPIEDKSFLYVGQIQHGARVGERQHFTYGADFIRTVPRTNGSINGANESDDEITEVGGYVQSETAVSSVFDVVLAARVDYHDRMDDVVFSPRAAIVAEPVEGHSFRLTWNRAFAQPTSNNFFLDMISSPTLGGLPFAVRGRAAPAQGFTFRSDCASPGVPGDLCMRSPFTPEALGGPVQPLPLDATLFWDAAVHVVAAQDPQAGAILGLLAQPDATRVSSVMRMLNPTTREFELVTAVTPVDPLKPSITNTIEAGYKAVIGGRLSLQLDGYYTRIENFISPLIVATPNVFFDPTTLGAYIGSEAARIGLPLTAENVAALTAGMARVPLGTVTPEQIRGATDAADILVTYRNFGSVELLGADLGATLLATDELSFSGNYSFVNRNLFENLDGVADVALNAPRHKGALAANYRDLQRGLSAEVRGRFVDGFPVNSGVYVGNVDAYTLFDVNVGYELPFRRSASVTITGLNVLDNEHQEMVGAPFLGRMVFLRLRHSF